MVRTLYKDTTDAASGNLMKPTEINGDVKYIRSVINRINRNESRNITVKKTGPESAELTEDYFDRKSITSEEFELFNSHIQEKLQELRRKIIYIDDEIL